MSEQYCVISDPFLKLGTGDVFEGALLANKLRAEGVIWIPTELGDIDKHSSGGCQFRLYGKLGRKLSNTPGRMAGVTLFMGAPSGYIYWLAYIGNTREGEQSKSVELRVTQNSTGFASQVTCGLTQEGNARHTITKGITHIGNRCRVSSKGDCLIDLDLYGHGSEGTSLIYMAAAFSTRAEAWNYDG